MKGLTLDNGNIAAGAFDFDGNVLQMPTLLYLKNKETGEMEGFPGWMLDQGKIDMQKYEDTNGYFEQFRANFVCASPYNKKGFDGLLHDVEKAIEKGKFSESFTVMKELFLIKARIWSLNTSRSNSPDNFVRVFQRINEKILSPEEKDEQEAYIKENYGFKGNKEHVVFEYFQRIVDYYTCGNVQTQKMIGLDMEETPHRKKQAMEHWLDRVLPVKLLQIGSFHGIDTLGKIIHSEQRLSVGFSDDSKKYILSLGAYFAQRVRDNRFNNYNARLFFTGPIEHRKELSQDFSKVVEGVEFSINMNDTVQEFRIDG